MEQTSNVPQIASVRGYLSVAVDGKWYVPACGPGIGDKRNIEYRQATEPELNLLTDIREWAEVCHNDSLTAIVMMVLDSIKACAPAPVALRWPPEAPRPGKISGSRYPDIVRMAKHHPDARRGDVTLWWHGTYLTVRQRGRRFYNVSGVAA